MIYIFDLIDNITYSVPPELEGSNIYEMIILIRTYNQMFTTKGRFRVKNTKNFMIKSIIIEDWQIEKLINDVKLELALEYRKMGG